MRDGTASKEGERNVAKIVGLKAEKDRIVYVNLDQIVTIEAIQGGSPLERPYGQPHPGHSPGPFHVKLHSGTSVQRRSYNAGWKIPRRTS